MTAKSTTLWAKSLLSTNQLNLTTYSGEVFQKIFLERYFKILSAQFADDSDLNVKIFLNHSKRKKTRLSYLQFQTAELSLNDQFLIR